MVQMISARRVRFGARRRGDLGSLRLCSSATLQGGRNPHGAGASSKQGIQLVLSDTARAAIFGLAIGYIAAAGAAKFLAQYLYGASPYDPRAYTGVAAVLAISGLLAAYLPARPPAR